MRRSRRAGPGEPRVSCSLDVVLLTAVDGLLAVLLVPDGKRWRIPTASWRRSDGSLSHSAAVLARSALGRSVAWGEQVGASCAGEHPDRADVSVTYAALAPRGTTIVAGQTWHPVTRLPTGLSSRHRDAIAAAVRHVRNRLDQVPVAFRLIGPEFTLSDLQATYELLLGRKLHKASFRRALQAAYLVEPTERWRSEGRGRPAQVFRYAPKRRRENRRMVRFELLSTDEPR
jgi:8-oxo-dGTP diphosphatase